MCCCSVAMCCPKADKMQARVSFFGQRQHLETRSWYGLLLPQSRRALLQGTVPVVGEAGFEETTKYVDEMMARTAAVRLNALLVYTSKHEEGVSLVLVLFLCFEAPVLPSSPEMPNRRMRDRYCRRYTCTVETGFI